MHTKCFATRKMVLSISHFYCFSLNTHNFFLNNDKISKFGTKVDYSKVHLCTKLKFHIINTICVTAIFI